MPFFVDDKKKMSLGGKRGAGAVKDQKDFVAAKRRCTFGVRTLTFARETFSG